MKAIEGQVVFEGLGQLPIVKVDPSTGTGMPPIMAFMVVRQTGSALSLRLLTPESRSESVSAGVDVCTDGTFEINVAYRNRPGSPFRHRSEVHYGAMLLTTDSSTPTRVEGEYWTDRKTIGSVTLTDRRHGHSAMFIEVQDAFAAGTDRDDCPVGSRRYHYA